MCIYIYIYIFNANVKRYLSGCSHSMQYLIKFDITKGSCR